MTAEPVSTAGEPRPATEPRHERGYIPLIDNRLRCKACEKVWPCEGTAPRAEHFAYDAITLDRIPDRATPRAEGLDVDTLLAAERVVQGWGDEITEGGMTALILDLQQALERRARALSRLSGERGGSDR